MAFRFYLDGNMLADEPTGWQDLVTEIKRDFQVHGLLIQMNATLIFTGDGYNYLDCIFNSTGFCNEVKVMIEEQCSEEDQFEKIFEGIIRNSQMQFDMNKCTVKAPLEDNSYYARIKNNKDIEAYPNVGKSKNGVAITPAALETCTMFDPSTGGYLGEVRKAYRVFELFKFIIAFISDGEVDFASSLFDIGGDFQGLFVTNGLHLSTTVLADYQNVDIGKLSFQTLMDEVYKIGNIGFIVETARGKKPVFRIEYNDYFYNAGVSDILQNANGVVKKVKTDQLYTLMDFGSDKAEDDARLSFPEDINFLGFKIEEYHLTGQCNVADTTLNIQGSFVRSSNVIQDILMGITASPQSQYDSDFIFVMAENVSAGVYRAKQYDILGTGGVPVFYNGNLTNKEIALRFLKAVPNSIAQYLGNGNDEFMASVNLHNTLIATNPGGVDVTVEPVHFPDDFTLPNFDTNNRYNNLTFLYTAPASGIYSFEAFVKWIEGGLPGNISLLPHFALTIRIKDATSVDIKQFDSTFVYSGSANALVVVNNVYLKTNWTAEVGFIARDIGGTPYFVPFTAEIGSYFKCTNSNNGGGIFQTYKPEDFKGIEYQFDYPIEYSRFKNIKANARDILGFNVDGLNDMLPWIEDLQYNHRTGKAKLLLLGTQEIFARDCGFDSDSEELREDTDNELREQTGDNELRE